MNGNWRKALFRFAALYDGVLGVAFFFFWPQIFAWFDVTPPNHGGYVQFSACLLIVFAALFMRIARNPAMYRDLIPYGMALKASYSGLVFWYQFTSGIPWMWVPWAWLDLGFLVAFALALQPAQEALRRAPAERVA